MTSTLELTMLIDQCFNLSGVISKYRCGKWIYPKASEKMYGFSEQLKIFAFIPKVSRCCHL
jgi:hypothetical protein